MGLEPGARGAPASASREPQRLPGPPLETAARGEALGPREGRAAGALRPGEAGVGWQHEGAPPQDGEGERRDGNTTGKCAFVQSSGLLMIREDITLCCRTLGQLSHFADR